ncbi:hypothetical protein [Microbispora bryophytorum]|uniref:Beta-ketoacyl synthase N-terminal domain-containing protein n=1 Tax=Microbispora bryophytorum subsp. camponoti TaxID=1677852 RepID=A0ABR8KSW4_9ACTN|nr:hypothetical protein [Microbispora camponoti]MBD3141854.1 hypothetical protein [Microbispora camponoti]
MSLSLETAVAYVPRAARPCHFEPDILEFNQGVLAPYGMRFDPSYAAGGSNTTFLELAEGVLREAPGPLPAPDLLIVAYALPDPHAPEKTLAAHLTRVFDGRPLSFAVSEQGLGAPFTALRIADAYLRSGRCRSVVLLILEQTSFPYPEPFVQDGDLVDSAVLLALGPAGGWELAGVGSSGPHCDLAALLDKPPGLPGDERPGDRLVVTGSWGDSLDLGPAGPKAHQAPPGSYCTGVWLEFARHHEEWRDAYRTIVFGDVDPRTGAGHVATFTRRERAVADENRRGGHP